ncbi:hypothetical protein Ga0003345_1615 [Idiomarinaceae bacterium HL-53]|nr:hypothetical protein Ga0003345_1615 [Idiomarinaceae bacterium HL-53]
MIRLLFLIPLILCLLWITYLVQRGYRIRDGKQGFIYIFIFSTVIAVFYTLMMWLTRV